jgi:hypothetical protein
VCSKNFSCKDKLKHHIDVKHDNKKPMGVKHKTPKRNVEDMRCGFPNCIKLFANKYNVKRHIENVHLKMRRRRHRTNNNGEKTSASTSASSTASTSANATMNTNSTNNNSGIAVGSKVANMTMGNINIINGHGAVTSMAKSLTAGTIVSSGGGGGIIALPIPGGIGNVALAKLEPNSTSTPAKNAKPLKLLNQQQQQTQQLLLQQQQQQQLQQIQQQQLQQQQQQHIQLQNLNALSSNLNLAGNVRIFSRYKIEFIPKRSERSAGLVVCFFP